MRWHGTRQFGFALAETIVSVVLVGAILIALAIFMQATSKFNRYQLTRQQCVAAAQAQLDSISATGRLIGDEDVQRLWPNVLLTVSRSRGDGKWQGTERVQVAATGRVGRTDVVVELSRYIRVRPDAAEGDDNEA